MYRYELHRVLLLLLLYASDVSYEVQRCVVGVCCIERVAVVVVRSSAAVHQPHTNAVISCT